MDRTKFVVELRYGEIAKNGLGEFVERAVLADELEIGSKLVRRMGQTKSGFFFENIRDDRPAVRRGKIEEKFNLRSIGCLDHPPGWNVEEIFETFIIGKIMKNLVAIGLQE